MEKSNEEMLRELEVSFFTWPFRMMLFSTSIMLSPLIVAQSWLKAKDEAVGMGSRRC